MITRYQNINNQLLSATESNRNLQEKLKKLKEEKNI